MSNPSKYDGFARYLIGSLHAEAAIVFVLGGELGNGFARAEMPQADPEATEQLRKLQVTVLRTIADDIEKGITQPDQPQHRRGSA